METQIRDVVRLRGSLRIALNDPDGNLVLERIIDNLAVTQGRSWALGQLESVNNQAAQYIGYIAIGSVTTAPTTADTLLGGEVTRVAIGTWVTSTLTANPPNWQAQVSYATNQGNTTLAEAGLFNTSTANTITMFAHATFTSFVKATSNTLNISWTMSD